MWENVRFSMNSTMPLFFVMLLGYVLYQKKFLSDAFVAGANKFVFYVALPVQLFGTWPPPMCAAVVAAGVHAAALLAPQQLYVMGPVSSQSR